MKGCGTASDGENPNRILGYKRENIAILREERGLSGLESEIIG